MMRKNNHPGIGLGESEGVIDMKPFPSLKDLESKLEQRGQRVEGISESESDIKTKG